MIFSRAAVDNGKIIEFFGDYWHANPLLFSAGYNNRSKTIEEVWEKDFQRINKLQKAGYTRLKNAFSFYAVLITIFDHIILVLF